MAIKYIRLLTNILEWQKKQEQQSLTSIERNNNSIDSKKFEPEKSTNKELTNNHHHKNANTAFKTNDGNAQRLLMIAPTHINCETTPMNQSTEMMCQSNKTENSINDINRRLKVNAENYANINSSNAINNPIMCNFRSVNLLSVKVENANSSMLIQQHDGNKSFVSGIGSNGMASNNIETNNRNATMQGRFFDEKSRNVAGKPSKNRNLCNKRKFSNGRDNLSAEKKKK